MGLVEMVARQGFRGAARWVIWGWQPAGTGWCHGRQPELEKEGASSSGVRGWRRRRRDGDRVGGWQRSSVSVEDEDRVGGGGGGEGEGAGATLEPTAAGEVGEQRRPSMANGQWSLLQGSYS